MTPEQRVQAHRKQITRRLAPLLTISLAIAIIVFNTGAPPEVRIGLFWQDLGMAVGIAIGIWAGAPLPEATNG